MRFDALAVVRPASLWRILSVDFLSRHRGRAARRGRARDDGCMSHGDDVPPDGVEFLDAGPERGMGAASRLRRRPKLLLLVVAAVAVAAAVTAVAGSGGRPAGSPATLPRA